MNTLTESGAGSILEAASASTSELVDEAERRLLDHRFVVLPGAFPGLDDAVHFMSQIAPLHSDATRLDGALMLDDLKDADDVVRSRFALPLHKDGVLTGADVLYVGIFCVALDGVTGGRTYLSDSMRALERVPGNVLDTLRRHGIEGMAVDTAGIYDADFEGRWTRLPAFHVDPDGGETLSLGMPHPPGEPESWRIRVADVDAARSDAVLQSLSDAFLDSRYTYFHSWQPGDMLLFDNRQMLHGREAWQGERRQMANIQVVA